MAITAAFMVLGCKVNKTDSDAISTHLSEVGINVIRDVKFADIIVVNSCIVTEESARKSRQAVRRMRRENPSAIIVLAGCMPRVNFDKKSVPEVDIIVKSADFSEISTKIFEFSKDHLQDFIKQNLAKNCKNVSKNRTRAYIKIQDGCNNFCAYCVIPHARGASKSRPLAEIAKEAQSLATKGFKDITLVGINLANYGVDFGDVALIDAVRTVAATGVSRVRLGSLEPDRIDSKFIKDLAQVPNFCPHFHISLQSGCDATLKRMNRRYLAADYAKICAEIREGFANAAITTDIMVGFPGESDEEFEQSLNFVKQINFSSVHVFSYSKRPNTAAFNFKNQVDENLKISRNNAMRAATDGSTKIYLQSFIGKVENVLFEFCKDNYLYNGLTENAVRVCLKSNKKIEQGEIIEVKIIGIEKDYLIGKI